MGPPPRQSFANISAYLCGSEISGSPATKAAIVARMRRFGRVPTFWKLSAIAATIANHGVTSRRARRVTTDVLIAQARSVDPRVQVVADFVSARRERVLAHEHVIYWLQCLALVVGSDSETEPSWFELAWLMLGANDHLQPTLQSGSGPATGGIEQALAMFATTSRFNVNSDPVAAHLRGYEITCTSPQTGPLSTRSAWEELHEAAFHGTFHDYFIEILSPLVVVSHKWGLRADAEGSIEAPVVHPDRWYDNARIRPAAATAVFERLSISESEARAQLLRDLDGDGIPRSPTIFAHRPFLKLDDGTLIAASPWLLREQLRLGLWDACRRASHSRHGPSVWNPAFGQSFELWARHAARRAEGSGQLRGRLVMSERIGDQDEFEDVVIVGDSAVMLGSAKSSLMPGDLLHHATDPATVVAWYEKLLFAEKKGRHNDGALRLLDRRVKRIRDGEAERALGVASDTRIYPVLITYERLGDNPLLHTWVRERCVAIGVLQQAEVAPVTFVSAGEFEWLMAAAARGTSLFDILERRVSTDNGLVSFESALRQFADEKPLRLPGVEDKYFELMSETTTRFFGRPCPSTSPDADVKAEGETG